MSDRPETRMIGLAGIAIFPDRMRALHPEVVADLAQSIKEIGLLNPITITPRDGIGYRLLAGRHRYEAVKKLGLESIEARIRANRECDPASYPRNLGCFDRAVRQARRRRVMEALATTTDVPPADGGERAAPDPACVWCRVAFRPRGAGGKKRFCSDRCRAAFHRGCRVWAIRAVDEGRLSLEVIRDASKKLYTDFLEASPSPGVEK